MAVFAFIGFGELGCSLAEGLGHSGAHRVRAYAPARSHAGSVAALKERLERSGAERRPALEEAVAGASAVLSVVPASASSEVAERCARALEDGCYYVDLAAAPVAEKQLAAGLVQAAGALYVDGAVLGTVATSGYRVPILASGPGAQGFRELVEPEGLEVEVIDAPAGHATLVKLLRSVYMKGRDALIVEMMTAARRYGLEQRVAESIKGPGEGVPFPELAERVLCALALHAGRRAEELTDSSEVVRAAGVDPVISSAGSKVLRSLAALELGEHFDSRRPSSASEVLALLEELSGRIAADP